MSDGPLFPKKSEVNEEPATGSQVEIERSNDPSTWSDSTSSRGVPSFQGKKIGCGTSVFGLLAVVALVVASWTVL